jgi:hypothetical protein
MKVAQNAHHGKWLALGSRAEQPRIAQKKALSQTKVGQAPHLESKESCRNALRCAGSLRPQFSLPIQSGRVGIRTRVTGIARGLDSDSTPIARPMYLRLMIAGFRMNAEKFATQICNLQFEI